MTMRLLLAAFAALLPTSAWAQGIKPGLVLPLGHTNQVKAAAYSPDGKTVVTAGNDRTARLWDVAGGKPIQLFTGHADTINSVAFNPEGTRIATASDDYSVKLWDVTNGRCIQTLKDQKNGSNRNAVTFSPDGKSVLVGCGDRTAKLYEVESGTLLRTFVSETDGHTDAVLAVAFGTDGKTLFTGSSDRMVKQWDTAIGRTLQTYAGHTSRVHSVAVAPDGKTLLSGGGDSTARLWDVAAGTETQLFKGHQNDVRQAVFSPDGKFVLTGSADKFAGLWDAATGKSIQAFAGHNETIYAVAFSPDGQSILTASGDRSARIHAVASGKASRTFLKGDEQVHGVAFSPDGKTAACASADRKVTIWDVATGQTLHKIDGHTEAVKAVAFSPDGKTLLTGSQDKTVRLWDTATGRNLHRIQAHTDYVNAVAFSPDGKILLTGSGDKTAKTWDAVTGAPLHTFTRHKGYVVAVAFSPDGKTIATGAESDYDVRLWDAGSGKELRRLKGHTDNVNGLAFSPDGKTLLSGSSDYTVRLWDVDSGTNVRTLKGHTSSVNAVAHCADGRTAVSGGSDNRTNVWDLVGGNTVNTFIEPDESVKSVAISRDGLSVLTGLSNKSIRLWDVNSGRTRAVLTTMADMVKSVALDTDPPRILVATGDAGRLWELDLGTTRMSTVSGRRTLRESFTTDKSLRLHVSPDGTARLSDSAAELCTIVTLGGGADWLVATPEGLFDGSARARELVAFRVGQSVVPVERFHRDFHHPGLLTALRNGERPKPKITVAAKPAPLVRIVSPADRTATALGTIAVTVEVTDQGGGVAGFALFHQGTRVFVPGDPVKVGLVQTRVFKVKLIEGENRFEAKASGEGGWESEPARLTVTYNQPLTQSDLYVLAVGVSTYADARISLKFAATDAKAFGAVFEKRGKQIYANVNVTYLLDEKATKAGILDALEALAKKAQPRDTLLVTIAGHGTTLGQRYYLLPHDFIADPLKTLEDNVKAKGFPVDELGEKLRQVPALKKVLILDTCGSGGATGVLQKGRNPFAFRGEIERLNRAEGVFTIAACAATEEAQEPKELGHGVLSYALLAGLREVDKKGPLANKGVDTANPNQVVDVLEWFSFAAGQTPGLMKTYFGREQDVHTSGSGTSFPLLPGSDK